MTNSLAHNCDIRSLGFIFVILHLIPGAPIDLQKVQKMGSDGTVDLQEITLGTFLCTEEDRAHQKLQIFGKRFVVIGYWIQILDIK